MIDNPRDNGAGAWNVAACEALIDELLQLRVAMLEAERRFRPQLDAVQPHWRASAINLTHYLAMRRHDIRRLQAQLAWVGVSSLGRAETHALASLDKVLGLLHLVTGRRWRDHSAEEPVGAQRGPALLVRHAEGLFGPPHESRTVRVMVTLPSEAAVDDALVARLVDGGMDIARINCAHDDPAAWVAMARRVRQQARRAGRGVRVLMDLAGPKLRTGPIASGPPVLKVRPRRDPWGTVTAPALLGLRPVEGGAARAQGAPSIAVEPAWLARVRVGDTVRLVDARGLERQFLVRRCAAGGVVLAGHKTAYLVPDTRLELRRSGHDVAITAVADLPPAPATVRLHRTDRLLVTPGGVGQPAAVASGRRRPRPARVPCTLPQVLGQVRRGERIWFDDGRIGGVIRRTGPAGLLVEITDCRPGGATLRADKGINLPDSTLHLPALTDKDVDDLAVVVEHADLVGLSFAQSAADVRALQDHLARLGGDALGIILKVETRRGFEHLPEMLLAAMGSRAAGVMIARGDLAIECGFERLAEVQEELLWACEAAHVPVVWATQVLERLAKTGQPSRAEITDAAMGGRAECVMLNKGPHIGDALHMLDDILRRMQTHQAKKRSLLRALRSWPVDEGGVA
ncbi:pyruvate kinase [Immundisolibacter sp.]|uniref:pyruvate kinase n=1 Tax=Immundisolibacter sp. TaxID=1934948 RepID=UPI003F861830